MPSQVMRWPLGGVRYTMIRRRLLQFLLLVLAADALIGSLLIFVGGRNAIARFVPAEAKNQVTNLFLQYKIENSAFRIGLGLMWLLSARQPERNPSVIIGTAVGLLGLGVAELIAPRLLQLQEFYPSHLVWAHVLARIGIGVTLFALFSSMNPQGENLERPANGE